MAARRDNRCEGISEVEQDGSERDLIMSLTGLTSEDLEPQEGNQLQELIECLPREDRVRIFLDTFCKFTAHVRDKLSPHEDMLDLATDTHLAGLEKILAIMLQTYLKHPDDSELNRVNAELTMGQIQKCLQALQKTHPATYQDVLKYINASPTMKGRDNSKTKILLKQLCIGKNPKTALASLLEFTGIQEESTKEGCKQHANNTPSYAILAAVLGGMGIVAIGVGIAIACTGIGGPVGCGASIAGATLLFLAGTVVCGGGIVAAGIKCARAVKTRKGKDLKSEEDSDDEIEESTITEPLEIAPPHDDPLIRGVGIQVTASVVEIGSCKSSLTSGQSCRSYIHNPHNWPDVVVHDH